MTLRALVVDDESALPQNLHFLQRTRPDAFELVGHTRTVAESIAAIEELRPDLVFLDIQLGRGTGFDVLNGLSYRDFQLIFVTAYNEHAVEAFRFSAVDYLLKPIESGRFWEAVERSRSQHQRQDQQLSLATLLDNFGARQAPGRKKIVLRERDAMHVVQLEEILYCTADRSYTTFYLTGERHIVVSQHLKEYEDLLDNNGFFRVHRSHLVHLEKVVRYDRSEGILYLHEAASVPVSMRRREPLTQALGALR